MSLRPLWYLPSPKFVLLFLLRASSTLQTKCLFAHLSKYFHTCPFLFFFVPVDQTFFGFVKEVTPRRPSYLKLTIVVKASIVVSLISSVSSVLLSGLKNCYRQGSLQWTETYERVEVFSAFSTARLPLNHLECAVKRLFWSWLQKLRPVDLFIQLLFSQLQNPLCNCEWSIFFTFWQFQVNLSRYCFYVCLDISKRKVSSAMQWRCFFLFSNLWCWTLWCLPPTKNTKFQHKSSP